jgi:putative transposase
LIIELLDLHADDPEFGYRFLHDELVAAGHGIGANRVLLLCRQNQVWSGRIVGYAMMVSFFSLLQKNVLDRQRWQTSAELTSQIVNWVDRTRHRRRRQPRLSKLTPVEFELVFTPQATAA